MGFAALYPSYAATLLVQPVQAALPCREISRRCDHLHAGTLDELARSYNVGISTIRRATRAA
jgi:hypothetical protein